ncbi:MAG: clan AA aspartic protease [Gammaproteobacteria bacterium]|nr:clan AA aspartic protease [Gammaproteobacteria bacterium]
MSIRFTSILILAIGFSIGWLGRGWWLDGDVSRVVSQDIDLSSAPSLEGNPQVADTGVPLNGSIFSSAIEDKQISIFESNQLVQSDSGLSPVTLFEQLLDEHQYQTATALYQEQDRRGASELDRLRALLLKRLDQLMKAREYSHFSELVDAFLSVYYDDIEVLLLLADFNYGNGFFIEAINIYQLIKAYAFTLVQKQQWLAHFDKFVNKVDQYYASQEDWFALSGLYSHIEVSGLLSASYQFRQAMAYLNGGDQSGAIERLKPLVDDSEVGDKARLALNSLEAPNVAASSLQSNPFHGAESVALQQAGNQYLVDLQINRRDDVTLLIDTGASMTTLSRSAFLALSSRQKARVVGQRIFQTANGVTKGTVYRLDQLRLGTFQLSNVDIAVLDFSLSPGVEGLLGMNVLGRFRFQIDQDNVSLLLNEK